MPAAAPFLTTIFLTLKAYLTPSRWKTMSLQTKLGGLSARLRFDNRLQLILNRLLFPNARFASYRLRGVEAVADHMGADHCGLWPCLVEGMYDPFLEDLRRGASAKPLTVVDIGANAGGFSLIFATRGMPVRKIAAVEMNPLTYSRMRLNLLTTYGPVAEPVNAAIGTARGTASVPFSFGSTGDVFVERSATTGFTVPVQTFDQFLDDHFQGETVDVVKMDIEGSEWDVIDSHTCNRLADCSRLIVEIHPRDGRGPPEFAAAMRPFGLSLSPVRNPQASDVFCFTRV